jgi:HK97 family phage prohead protease
MKDVYQYKSFGLSVKDVDAKEGIVTGYFANFNTLDSDGDIIRPGAFIKSIQENGPNSQRPRIKHLQNHDVNKPLGKLTELKEDSQGLAYESQVGTHNLGQDFIKMIESGLITEHSIGYSVIKRNQLQDYEGYMKNPDAGWYELTELKLWEGSSLTGWGANMYTPLTGLKSEEKAAAIEKVFKRRETLLKAIKDGTFTDETFDFLIIEEKQLQQLFIDLSKATVPDDATQPVSTDLKAEDVLEQVKKILTF